MSYIKSIIFSMLLLCCVVSNAQETFQKHGILRAQATICPGVMLNSSTNSIYIHGDLEYYFEERLSVRGDSYYFLSHNSGPSLFTYNHSSFAGLSYHFTSNKKFDPFLAFEPGVAFSKADIISPLLVQKVSNSTDPLLSAVVGMNLYASKYFHLLANVRYVYGKHISESAVISLNELRFSFGLGFNLGLKKKKETLPPEPQFKN